MKRLVRWWNRLIDKVIENDLNDHSLLTDVDCHISRTGGTLPENANSVISTEKRMVEDDSKQG